MNKDIKEVINCIFVGLCLGGVVIWGIISFQQDRELKLLQIEYNTVNNNNVAGLVTAVDTLNKKIDVNYRNVIQKIDVIPQKIYSDKIKLEQTLKQINVMVMNKTKDALGSGVSIKYKGKFYILTAGHMAEDITDELYLNENGQEICKLKVVKQDYNFTEEQAGNDLLLLKPEDDNIQPRFYTELADMETLQGTEVYIVGNPLGIEDTISDGRIVKYSRNFMYYIGYTYFGNSGGGVYNNEGKLVGIVSHLIPIEPFPDKVIVTDDPEEPIQHISGVPAYMVHGAVRLEAILKFLEEVN
jgi:S1-C subfamily serine protease